MHYSYSIDAGPTTIVDCDVSGEELAKVVACAIVLALKRGKFIIESWPRFGRLT